MTESEIYELLKLVIDPELHVNIVDLGLIYKVEVNPDATPKVRVLMTLTSPGCPLAGSFNFMVKDALSPLPVDVETDVQVDLTFDPPWTQEMMSQELQAEFGLDEWYQ